MTSAPFVKSYLDHILTPGGGHPARKSRETQQGKKEADKGTDGWSTSRESDNLNVQRIAAQIKGWVHVGAQHVKDLIGTARYKISDGDTDNIV